jgi:protein SCO1/2
MRRAATAAAMVLWLLRPAAAHEDLSDLAFHPHPGARLPLLAQFEDEEGRTEPLARYFVGGPVVLVLQYLHCRDLCAPTLQNLLAALPPGDGRGVPLVVLSIDPRDTPAAMAAAKRQYAPAAENVHFLAGTATAVQRVADTVGFPYRWDRRAAEFVHPAGFVVAAPDGRISRYFLGIAVNPASLRAGLAAAQAGSAQGPLVRLLLLCHLGVPAGRWTASIEAAFALANLAAAIGLVAVFCAIRRRRHG